MTRAWLYAALLLALASVAAAEEGGSGHYLPGQMASFIDAVPADETFLVRYNFITYDGSASARVPIGGQIVAQARVSSIANGLTILWRPPIDLGERWSYAMNATIPFVDLHVTGNVTLPGGNVVGRGDSLGALGDIVLQPVLVNYHASDDINWNARLSVYLPTGSYEVGQLANTGKNYWTYEPAVAFMYLGKHNGRELSAFLGMDFNATNSDTEYKTGTQAHLEVTAAQHFPLAGGLAGAGLTGYWYQQIEADSGAGATLGSFEGRTAALGPVASYVSKVSGHDVIAELKWLHEFDTRNRFEGDTIFLKVLFKFY